MPLYNDPSREVCMIPGGIFELVAPWRPPLALVLELILSLGGALGEGEKRSWECHFIHGVWLLLVWRFWYSSSFSCNSYYQAEDL